MEPKTTIWASLGISAAVFAVVDLLVAFFTPAPQRGIALIPPSVAAVVACLTLPNLFRNFERQQERIERQRREIEILHAMDTAIAAEMDLPQLLNVSVRKAITAVDAEMGGIVLFDPKNGKLIAEAYIGSENKNEESAFRNLVRGGGGQGDRWHTVSVPLTIGTESAPTGRTPGYLVAAKRHPTRSFTPADHALLHTLTSTVAIAISNARALEAVQDASQVKAELERERRIARALTEGLLPEIPARAGNWVFSMGYEAQSSEAQVGGDIYDLFPLGDGRWGVLIADVSGKGLRAARQTAMVKYSLRSYAREHTAPSEVLTRLNDALHDDADLIGFVTLLYGVLEENGSRFTYASAGHEPPVVRRSNGSFELLQPTGMVLGAMRGGDYHESHCEFVPGDAVLLYTDGLTEARSPEGIFLQTEGLQEILREARTCPAAQVADTVLEAVRSYTHNHLSDDTALLWIECAENR